MKRVYISLFVIALFCSCENTLDLTPRDTISDATFYKTAADFKLAANRLYRSLPEFDFSDTEADIAFNTANAISTGDYVPTETVAAWTNGYAHIRNANNIIEKGSETTDAAIAVYVAEARFFRAFNYWQLFRLFGGVPLITKLLAADDPDLYMPRASRQETIDFILGELASAASALPLQSELAAADVGRITRGAADALRARVALFEGTWQQYRDQSGAGYLDMAISAAGNVITSGEYGLFTDRGADSYRYLFIEEGDDSRESILDRRYEFNIIGNPYPYQIDATCYLATRKLTDMYLCDDGLPITQSARFNGYSTISSEFEHRDPRMTMTLIVPGTATLRPFHPATPVENWPDRPQRNPNTGYITYKYLSENAFGNANNGATFDYDRHIIRYAEVLLIYAEALLEKNGALSDTELNSTINLIRARAGMPALTNTFLAANGLDLKTEIRRERTVELAFEGFRYDDVRRWKTAETEMVQDIKGIKIKGTAWSGIAPYDGDSYQSRTDAEGFLIVQPASARRFDPARHYLRPLPTREIALYGGRLEQNPNW